MKISGVCSLARYGCCGCGNCCALSVSLFCAGLSLSYHMASVAEPKLLSTYAKYVTMERSGVQSIAQLVIGPLRQRRRWTTCVKQFMRTGPNSAWAGIPLCKRSISGGTTANGTESLKLPPHLAHVRSECFATSRAHLIAPLRPFGKKPPLPGNGTADRQPLWAPS